MFKQRRFLYAVILILLVWLGVAYATTFSFTYDLTTPQGSDDPAEADDRMREIKAGLQERLAVEHRFALTGTEVSAADTGEHTDITTDSIANAGTLTVSGESTFDQGVTMKSGKVLTTEIIQAVDATGILLKNASGDTVATIRDDARLQLSIGQPINEFSTDGSLAGDSNNAVPTEKSVKTYVDEATLNPGTVKAWGRAGPSGGLEGTGFNISSVSRTSIGVYVVTWGTAFADGNYAVNITPFSSAGGRSATVTVLTIGSATIEIVKVSSSSLVDSAFLITANGTQ